MQLRKRLDNSKYQHNSVSQILSAWQIIQQKSNTGGGPDRGGDLGGVLHHPRVRGPGRVRPHPQDHPGGEEEGCQGSSKSLNQEQMTFAAMDNLKRLSAA